MYCTRCGAQNADNARFCTSCGASVELGGAANGGQGYPGGAAFSAAPRKRLHRVMADKKVAGVCSGFAEYFDMDVTLVRLIWVAMVLIPPSIGAVVYLVAWIILPRD